MDKNFRPLYRILEGNHQLLMIEANAFCRNGIYVDTILELYLHI